MSDRFASLREAAAAFRRMGYGGPLLLRGCKLDVVGLPSIKHQLAYLSRAHANDNRVQR